MQLLCTMLGLLTHVNAAEAYRITLIDVGYGLSVLVQDPSGIALLMDGGYREEAPMVHEALAQEGVDSIALMIASQGHDDHLEGLALLLSGLRGVKSSIWILLNNPHLLWLDGSTHGFARRDGSG